MPENMLIFLLFSYAKIFHFIKLSSVNDMAMQFLIGILSWNEFWQSDLGI